MSAKIIVPWHNRTQFDKFLQAWRTNEEDERFLFVQDTDKSGCALTKNRGIELAIDRDIETVIILDDDCYPAPEADTVEQLIGRHLRALQTPFKNEFRAVTDPPSRGTPYFNRSFEQTKIAASMGFWTHVGDYDACAQLIHGAKKPMTFCREIVRNQYFPLCGMNLAFRPKDWWPWCQFIDVSRFDDIWQGLLWQKEAYRRGYAFNLNGPLVVHSRQSNVWANLRDEAKYLEDNETIWQRIAESDETDYDKLRALLPV